jgi:CRP/FNR family transcriptional regulator, cyclic AMP receptor protein
MVTTAESELQRASLSAALVTVFRGKFCDTLLPNRLVSTTAKGSALYDAGDVDRQLFFIRRGVIKVGAVTDDGREVIYDLRKDGDVAGELCVCETPRRDRAVALEPTEWSAVPYEEILDSLQQNREALHEVFEAICRALSSAYDQVSLLSSGGTLERLVKVLLRLTRQVGRSSDGLVELDVYLTQEEISHMMASSRERVSVALNLLRDRAIVQYARGGHLLVDVHALQALTPA